MGKLTNYLLGGNTATVVGDGYGVVARPASSESSISAESFFSSASGYFAPVNIKAIGVKGSRDPSQNLQPNSSYSAKDPRRTTSNNQIVTADEFSFGSPQCPTHQLSIGNFGRIPNGVRAPRCSLAPTAPATTPEDLPRTSMESYHTAAQNLPVAEKAMEKDWQDYDVPQELGSVNDDFPNELRAIIRESFDEHRAMRASRIQAAAMVKLTANTTPNLACKNTEPEVAERPAMASKQSAPGSEYTANQSTSSLTASLNSNTSLESGSNRTAHLKAPTNWRGPSTPDTSQECLGGMRNIVPNATMTEIERKFQAAKSRTRKGYKMFKVLPGRRMKDEPTPPLLKSAPAVSECTSCFDEIAKEKAVKLPCRHEYCPECFSHLVSTAVQSEDTFPPKCCLSEVPRATMRQYLSSTEMSHFRDKALEFAVPAANRYYCATPTCAKWINTRIAKRANGALECPHCKGKLCTICRGSEHPKNEACPQDYGLERAIESAERAGWRRCYNCHEMVERNSGCRHMICRCKAQFCYVCGAKWIVNRHVERSTCKCTEADLQRRDREVQERLTRYEAEQTRFDAAQRAQRTEEEEVRAAIAAVEEAERAVQLEQEAEEAADEARVAAEVREIEMLEQRRLFQIADYYKHLRGVLEMVRLQQRQAIENRHDRDWAEVDKAKDELESAEKATERERTVNAKRESIIARTESTIKTIQRKHATTMMETIARHRRTQDDILAASLSSTDADAEMVRVETLQELLPAQDAERACLKFQQAREIQKWKVFGEQALREFDPRSAILQLRLEDFERISQREKELKAHASADRKWFDLLFSERMSMLAEDERRMMRTGAESPLNPAKAPELTVRDATLQTEAPSKQQATPKPKAAPTPSREVPSLSTREQLGLLPPAQTSQERYVRPNRRGVRHEMDWADIRSTLESPGRRARGCR